MSGTDSVLIHLKHWYFYTNIC